MDPVDELRLKNVEDSVEKLTVIMQEMSTWATQMRRDVRWITGLFTVLLGVVEPLIVYYIVNSGGNA